MVSKMIHCQTCGYEEHCEDVVVYCSQCCIVMVHRYCRDGPIIHGDDEEWCCEECCPRVVKHEEACMKTQSLEDNEDKYLMEDVNLERLRKCVVDDGEVDHLDGSIKCLLQLSTDPSDGIGDKNQEARDQSIDDRECPSEMLIDEENEMHANEEYVKEELHANIEHEINDCKENDSGIRFANKLKDPSVCATLISRPIYFATWSGTCRVYHDAITNDFLSLQMKAHLCETACLKVADAAQTLPVKLDLEIVPKGCNLPKSFSMSSPSSEDIGLYFFPVHESDKKQYSLLLEKMIVGKLVLKFTRRNLKLLVFTSMDLPKENRSFEDKLYLWAVFCATMSSSPSSTKICPSLTELSPSSTTKLSPSSTNTFLGGVRLTNYPRCDSRKNDNSNCIPVCVVQAISASSSSNSIQCGHGSRVNRVVRHQTNRRRKLYKRYVASTKTCIKEPCLCSFHSRLQAKWKNNKKNSNLYPSPINRNWNL